MKSRFAQKYPFALVPAGDLVHVVVDPTLPELVAQVCDDPRMMSSVRVTSSGKGSGAWQVAATVTIQSGARKSRTGEIRLATGTSLTELEPELWDAFVNRLAAKGMKIHHHKLSQNVKIDGCYSPFTTLPIFDVQVGKTTVRIHPRDYVIYMDEVDVKQGRCTIAVNKKEPKCSREACEVPYSQFGSHLLANNVITIFDAVNEKDVPRVGICTSKYADAQWRLHYHK